MSDTLTTDDTTTTDDTATEAQAPEATASTEAPAADKPKRGRGALEAEVKKVCDEFAIGGLKLDDGELLTPHRIGKIISDRGGVEVSTGAVAANLDRWKEIGFVVLNDKPVAFLDYTDAGRSEGLAALKAAASERKRAARKAAKDAEKAAAPASDPTSPPADPAQPTA